MYTKVFRSIYDGTLADNWRAMVTFQQLLILADADGVVDMTLSAIARTTGIPMEILQEGIKALEDPDPASRTPDMEGRRIARLDQHREWGWFLVNFKKYKQMQCRDEKREADRTRIAAKRKLHDADKCSELSRGVAECSVASPAVADVAHTYTYKDTDKEHSEASASVSIGKPTDEPAPKESKSAAVQERLARVTSDAIDAYNASRLVKPKGGLLASVNPKIGAARRQAQVRRCIKVARDICQEGYGGAVIVPEFWRDYWDTCADDPFLSGRGERSAAHANWMPDFEYLTKEATMVKVYEKAGAE